MTVLTDEQRARMRGDIGVMAPRPRFLRDFWITALDRLVRILTLGRGRVIVPSRRAPIHWDGVMR